MLVASKGYCRVSNLLNSEKLFLSPGAVSTVNITVLGCGVVSWKPPAVTGGEMPGYVIRFFDGDTYETSRYKEIQRYFDDPERRWAEAANLSSTSSVRRRKCCLSRFWSTQKATAKWKAG